MSHRMPLNEIDFISRFAAFCRTKGDERYDYTDPFGCALAQFVDETGRTDAESLPFCERMKVGFDPIEDSVLEVALNSGKDGGYNFSALADRLEALIVDAPVVERAR